MTTDDFLSRHDKMARLDKCVTDNVIAHVKLTPFAVVVLVINAIAVGMVLLAVARSCDREPYPAVSMQQACTKCHNPASKLAGYFKSKGSKNPEAMANAVLRTRSPRLLSAMAVVESGGNSTVRKAGYKGRHDGAFQVNPKHWGAVPVDAAGQALQAETILEELVENKNIVKALNYYGGENNLKRGKYAYNVLEELKAVPR